MDYRVTLKHQWSKSGRGKRWIVVLLSATFISLIYAARNVVGSVSAGRPIDWAWQVGYQFLYWYVWAAFTPLILWGAGRFDPEYASRRRVAPLLAMGFLIAPLQASIEYGLALTIESLRHASGEELSYRTQQFGRGILLESFTNIIIYALIVAGHYSYEYYRRYRERQLRSAELEGRLAQAELQNLKMQLQPHFLFNTLHTISVLMMRDAGAANRVLVRLGDLLRLSLDHVGSQEVSLKQELEFLNGYLEIEQARFQDRLKINRRVDPVTLDAVVPTLLLQPLVENAIRHGVSKRLGTGVVEIRSKRINSSLHLEIQDNGPGLEPAATAPPKGLGLANTRARLQQLYGSQHQFELKAAPAGGLVVSILIPFRTYEHYR
jgi:two-component system, LytTR family, sensor kinase